VKLNYPDIERNGYCFTDGCGYISPCLAQKVADKHQVKTVSAVQIRIGGAKGVCMIKPDLKTPLVKLRGS
jgi:RNA-dependent RNA polymerase